MLTPAFKSWFTVHGPADSVTKRPHTPCQFAEHPLTNAELINEKAKIRETLKDLPGTDAAETAEHWQKIKMICQRVSQRSGLQGLNLRIDTSDKLLVHDALREQRIDLMMDITKVALATTSTPEEVSTAWGFFRSLSGSPDKDIRSMVDVVEAEMALRAQSTSRSVAAAPAATV